MFSMTKICKNCKNTFPTYIFIDDKWRNLKNRTVCFDCNPYKSGMRWNVKHLFCDEKNKLRECGDCRKIKSYSLFYKDSHARIGVGSFCKKCHDIRTKNRTGRLKQKAIDYKGGSCYICDYNKCNRALHFHHRKSKIKEFKISGNIKTWKKLVKELDKCDLVCANCHAEIHDD